MKISSSQLKNFILDPGLVTRFAYTNTEKESEEKNTSPENILVSQGLLSEDDIRRMQAYVLGVPFINLLEEKIPYDVLSMTPEPVARTHNVVAYKKNDRELEVAMLDVEDLLSIEFIKLSSTIRVVIGQRLVRKLYGEKEEYTLSKEEIISLQKFIDINKVLKALLDKKIIKNGTKVEDIIFYKPKTSEKAPDGYKGRMVINEVMTVSSAINELILKQASTDTIEKQARLEGMLTMAEDGFFKAAQGSTTIEEVLRVIND